ncbi:PQQ-binding-like beta-propeller repeat protein [candidate division WOR-3 bacterium]|nr:PQQ-binding-like beta-propeller repeat protein [candidate division WOR-3 bacterium]
MRRILLTIMIISITFIFIFATTREDLLIEGFENFFPPAGWTIFDFDGNSNYSNYDAWQSSTFEPYNGTYSARSTYSSSGNTNHWFISPKIDLTNYQIATLNFYHKLKYNDDGANYLKITTNTDSSDTNGYTVLETFIYESSSWEQYNIDLSYYKDSTIFLAWQTTRGSGYEYWYIDDILFTADTMLAHDVELYSYKSPPKYVLTERQYTPIASVKNIGANTETFYVYLDIDSSGTIIYNDSTIINNLPPDSTEEVNFNLWTPSNPGISYSFSFYTNLSEDQNHKNDTLISTIYSNYKLAEEQIHPIWTLFMHDRKHSGRINYAGLSSADTSFNYSINNGTRSSPVIGRDSTVYLGSEDGYLYAMLPDLSGYKWRYNASSEPIRSTPSIDTAGNIYFTSNNGYLYSITCNGDYRWSYYLGVASESPVMLGPDNTAYIAALDTFYAIDSNGLLKWSFILPGNNFVCGAVMRDNIIYFGVTNNHRLFAVKDNGASYEIMWTKFLDAGISSSPSVKGDTIYFVLNDGKLYALRDTGTSFVDLWQTQIDSPKVGITDVYYSSPAIGFNHTIYVGTPYNKLVAVYPDGEIKWKFGVSDRVWSSPTIDSSGTIYFGSNNDTLYSLIDSFSFAVPKWKYASNGNIDRPIAINGVIYFTSHNSVYRIGNFSSSIDENRENDENNPYILKQNTPNPFTINRNTSIKYMLKSDCYVSLNIFDISGKLIKRLVSEKQNSGWHIVKWDGRTDSENKLKPGVYFYKINAENYINTKKMILLD